jgi:putative PIN family toxin of toxin-antitoxin system
MKIMIDTNIFISAVLFPKGCAAEALCKAMTLPYQPVICDYIIDELHRKFQEKFADKTLELEAFLYIVLPVFDVVSVPEEAIDAEAKIRDPKDRPILRAALNAGVDLFLTGDKDFLESAVEDPRIISVQTFLDM